MKKDNGRKESFSVVSPRNKKALQVIHLQGFAVVVEGQRYAEIYIIIYQYFRFYKMYYCVTFLL